MFFLARAALEALPGVEYADARVVRQDGERLHCRSGSVERVDRKYSEGIGVRVLDRGAWGFAARPGTSETAAVGAAREALEVAHAAASIARHRIRLAPEAPPAGTWSTPYDQDPFEIPLAKKIADLSQAVQVLQAAPGVLSAEAKMLWRKERKWFASTEGGHFDQTTLAGGAGLKIVVGSGDERAVRSWPGDLDGGIAGRGYEFVEELDLVTHAEHIREEAVALLSADPCPSRDTTLLLGTPQLALQIHESCGHPTEADRALGEEISLAGGSFLSPDKRGSFRYGAHGVHLIADATTRGGTGTFGWDDEGVAARRTPLVEDGLFVDYLSSRETAARMGLSRSAGCMRAESWSRPPIIRMINVSLEPDPKGPKSLEELIADTDDGILMTTNRSWSIDDLRLNFQFGCEAAWEIRHGRIQRLLKQPVYTGITPRFWGGCETICGPESFQSWGFVSCGKGDPIQLMAVGHGCAPARFRHVTVGSSGALRG